MNITMFAIYGVGAVALVAAGSLMLPRHIHIERKAMIDTDPQTIIALASSNEGYQKFNPYRSTDPDLQISLFGPDKGVGSGFHFDGKDGKGSQIVAELSTDKVIYNIDLGAMGKPNQAISTRKTEHGVEVTWSMNTDLGMNPAFRIFGLFMDGFIGKTLEQGLRNLASAT